MTTDARVASGTVGGTVAALLLGQLFLGFAFGSMCPDDLTPEERRSLLLDQFLIQPPQPIVMSVTYAVLNACLFLCMKAVANPPTFWKHTLRHLLVSSVLAAVPFAWLLLAVLVHF